MTVWGVSCHLKRGEPVVVVLRVAGSRAAATSEQTIKFAFDPGLGRAQNLRELAAHIASRLVAETPDVVVLKSLDQDGRRPHGPSVTRPHYQVEGLLLGVITRDVAQVHALTGKEIADRLGIRKADAEADATVRFGGDTNAAIAALAALSFADAG
jgi:hypothetical protein